MALTMRREAIVSAMMAMANAPVIATKRMLMESFFTQWLLVMFARTERGKRPR
jgi:hypothetical protein